MGNDRNAEESEGGMSDPERRGLHGGMGLALEMPISKMWRDARSFMITEGPVEVMRATLARSILNQFN